MQVTSTTRTLKYYEAKIFVPQTIFVPTFQPEYISERNRYLVSLGVLWDPFQTTPHTPIPAEVLITGKV